MRDAAAVSAARARARPEVVLHLAAQPMVRRSLREPAATYEVNVIGTVNVLEAVRGRRERARGGGRHLRQVLREPARRRRGASSRTTRSAARDPYSSSKACAELWRAAYRRSFFSRERRAAARDGARRAT